MDRKEVAHNPVMTTRYSERVNLVYETMINNLRVFLRDEWDSLLPAQRETIAEETAIIAMNHMADSLAAELNPP